MKKRFYYTLFILTCLLTASCGQAQKNADPKSYTPEELALRHDIAQMLLVGFRGTEVTDTMHIVRDIKEYGVGGVILFEYDAPSHSRPRNITSRQQLKTLCTSLQGLSETALLIGIDQEGGNVNRLKEKYGFPAFASAEKSAREGDRSVRAVASSTAKTLNSLGINLNFAPCVDVNVNPKCPIIGKLERSFSTDTTVVARCATIWLEEQQRQGVIPCLKHFPGHGSSLEDTHLGLADVSETWKTWELSPYRELISYSNSHPDEALHAVPMIMTTHVFNSRLDNKYPATLSHATLTGLLRQKLGYKGVIITDDLAMGAMTQQYEYRDMLRLTINAGADMLCLSNNGSDYNGDIVPQTVDIIFDLVKKGEIPEERIHESAQRIAALKATLPTGK